MDVFHTLYVLCATSVCYVKVPCICLFYNLVFFSTKNKRENATITLQIKNPPFSLLGGGLRGKGEEGSFLQYLSEYGLGNTHCVKYRKWPGAFPVLTTCWHYGKLIQNCSVFTFFNLSGKFRSFVANIIGWWNGKMGIVNEGARDTVPLRSEK
jgi:hypothetical protein